MYYCQTCVERPPLGPEKSGCNSELVSIQFFLSLKRPKLRKYCLVDRFHTIFDQKEVVAERS
jgi:hypothetical protein